MMSASFGLGELVALRGPQLRLIVHATRPLIEVTLPGEDLGLPAA